MSIFVPTRTFSRGRCGKVPTPICRDFSESEGVTGLRTFAWLGDDTGEVGEEGEANIENKGFVGGEVGVIENGTGLAKKDDWTVGDETGFAERVIGLTEGGVGVVEVDEIFAKVAFGFVRGDAGLADDNPNFVEVEPRSNFCATAGVTT